ncbi:glycogen synthase GlgA [Reyranella soli]|uniref:Glycogen synthase n=1 Tax=Reyranella soli TaxID=1230389 RepID=A0A512N227_9HYPH|nr:glycogen synthase GlgA [Reyranella soli]GEP53034.1 glycogen synthase [Reyranella soli]
MKVLFVTSEFADFTKAGGLGEVAASLPRALKRGGTDIRILLPAYPEVIAKAGTISIIASLPGRAEIEPCFLGEVRTPDGLILYLVLAPSLYQRGGTPYGGPHAGDWPDNDLRFARLALAAAEIAKGQCAGLAWKPNLLHVNDWPGGLAPAYLRWDGASLPTVFTIHNIAYQGVFNRDRLHGLGIPEAAFHMHGVEFYNRLSFLKAGVFYSDEVTTVSPTYAREITTEALGWGLHGLMQTIAADGRLVGILNGLDDSWDPSSDPQLPDHFDSQDLSGKRALANLVRTGLCLKPSDGPLFGIVSRLVHQKGLDMVSDVAEAIVQQGGQFAILGLGDPQTELLLGRLARGQHDHIAFLNGFNEAMARRILGASDFCLMPSRFEPCGLVQMQAQRYGALPIARATGGLADTIEDDATGFLFTECSAAGLHAACQRALRAYGDPVVFENMRRAAMCRRFSWSTAAEQYEALYRRSIGRPVSDTAALQRLRHSPSSELRAVA